jgi:hypothetical protein
MEMLSVAMEAFGLLEGMRWFVANASPAIR